MRHLLSIRLGAPKIIVDNESKEFYEKLSTNECSNPESLEKLVQGTPI